MGCTESKVRSEPKKPDAAHAPAKGNASHVTRRCHYCGKSFSIHDVSAHTVVCEEREVTCHHSWCRKILKQRDLKAHMHECQQDRRALCPKCGESFAATELSAHRGVCDVVQCDHCPERVIPRMLKYCPNTVLGKMQHRVGPFATERLRDKYLFGLASPVRASPAHGFHYSRSMQEGRTDGSTTPPQVLPPLALSQSMAQHVQSQEASPLTAPLAAGSIPPAAVGGGRGSSQSMSMSSVGGSTMNGRPMVNYQVARIQHLWRWAKARAAMEDLLFRVVYRELDSKKETFSIFKAHDHRILDEEHRARQKKLKSEAPRQAVEATAGHYFPVNNHEPITVDVVQRVIEDFNNKQALPYYAVWRILNDANNLLKALPNITRLAPPEGAKQVDGRWRSGGKVVVVGDLHGQLQDLLTILNDHALPSEQCLYVFNGDFVDRGHHGLEIVLILFLLLLVFPNFVALNRGNHECEYMNEEYGFDVEVQTKYDRNIYKLIQRCFCALPLATVIGTRVFIVHGGLPRSGDVTFEEIDTIQRFRQIPMPEVAQPEEDEIFQDMMWSDPHEEPGWTVSSRGVGAMFGPDVTSAFLKVNKLELVVRSHEEFTKGYESHHGGKLLTVFSASNYDGIGSNYGSIITILGDSAEFSVQTWACTEDDFMFGESTNPTNPNESLAISQGMGVPLTPHFGMTRTFSATTMSMALATPSQGSAVDKNFGHFCASLLGNINLLAMTGKAAVNVLQPMQQERRTRDDVVHTIRERIYERRHRLLAYFTKIDRTQKGSVWKMEWVEAMSNVMNLDLPWFFLRPNFTHTEPITHRIRYISFLARFRNGIHDLWFPSWRTAALADLHYKLFGRRRHPVAKLLSDRTEAIGYNEFCGLVRQVEENVSDNELFHLFLTLADNGHWESYITGPRMLTAMQEAVKEYEEKDEFDEVNDAYCGWDLQTMDQLAAIIGRLGASLLHKIFRVEREAPIRDFAQFADGVNTLARGSKRPLVLNRAAVRAIWEFLLEHCIEPEKGITIDELLLAFAVRDFQSLRERREAFIELTSRLLGEEGGQMLRRRYSTTFVGFGPTPPVQGSPVPNYGPPGGDTRKGSAYSDFASSGRFDHVGGSSRQLPMTTPKNQSRRPTGMDTPPPQGGPLSNSQGYMSAYAMRREMGNTTPAVPNSSLAMPGRQRSLSLEDVGGSLDDTPANSSNFHQSPERRGSENSGSKQSPPSLAPTANVTPPGSNTPPQMVDPAAMTVGPDDADKLRGKQLPLPPQRK